MKRKIRSTHEEKNNASLWHITLRIIQGRDLPNGKLRIRAMLQEQQKATRLAMESNPVWKQNLAFTLCEMDSANVSEQFINLKLTKASKFNEKAIAHWELPLSSIMELKDRTLDSKWIGLRSCNDGDQEDHCGFLKVSVSIQNGLESPKPLVDDLSSHDVWFTSAQEHYSLRFRLFRITHLAPDVIDMFKKKKKLFEKVFIEVSAGEQSIKTALFELGHADSPDHYFEIKMNQDLFLCFVWPSVLSKIALRFYGTQGKSTTCLAEANIKLQDIYRIGENGFMPLFGPSFINFHYSASTGMESHNYKYALRLHCSIDTVDYTVSEGSKGITSNASYFNTGKHIKDDCYTLYCAFSTCNQINPLFGSNSISFHVSMGQFGSVGMNNRSVNCCTIGTMPVTDEYRYFSMPWGNHKPVAKFECFFENIEYRMHQSNAILKVSDMFSQMLKLIQKRSQNDAALASSYFIESLEHARHIMKRLELNQLEKINNDFDRKIENFRKHSFELILKEINSLRSLSVENIDAATQEAGRAITQLNETLKSLARDIQMSLPDITIHMVADGKVVGYSRVPVQEVLYHPNDAYRGLDCGRVRPLRLKWVTNSSKYNRLEEFVGILHAKIWFGNSAQIANLRMFTQPGELKCFDEIFQYEKKSVTKQWDSYGPEFTDEECASSTKEFVRSGNWMVKKTQEMWISANVNTPATVVDKIYELQERIDGKWVDRMNTDYFGTKICTTSPPKGYEYKGKFHIDPHTNKGDQNGWLYSSQMQFWGNTILDKNDRPCYRFRRRCLTRICKRIVSSSKTLEEFKTEFPHQEWEYSRGISLAYHSTDLNDANYRRRIFFVEQEDERSKALPRMFEIHNCTTIWQLRCYILWAKDLLPLVKDTVGLFVRITFLHRTTQTLVVSKSQNPIWNETLLFDKFPIPGAIHEICLNPPIINIEIRGEKADNSELFLGSFQVCPTVVADALDERAKLEWNLLMYQKEKTKGSLLSSFELFHTSQASNVTPNLPTKKSSQKARFDIPPEIKPKFQRYAVHILCWGLRNITKNLKVRKPFLKILVGNRDFKTDVIHNLNINPNFPEPIITFPEVHLPQSLELSPPIVINLYDSQSFVRQRLLGVCQLSKYDRYIVPTKTQSRDLPQSTWKDFDEAVRKDTDKDETLMKLQPAKAETFDWWSKYYASQGDTEKAPQYLESGAEGLNVLDCSLEDHYGRNGFIEFLDRFQFIRCQKVVKDYDDIEFMGELKGKIFINPFTHKDQETIDPPSVEFMGPVKCCVRVYIIEANDLVSVRTNGLINPYIVVQCGDHQQSFREFYQPDSSNPVFGQSVELQLTVPVQKDLQIHVLDRHSLFADERIGTTSIDLEDRLFSKWRATVGLPCQYNTRAASVWRDQMSPMETLKKYCVKMEIPEPKVIESDGDIGLEVMGCTLWYSKIENDFLQNDSLLKRRWVNRDKAPSESCTHSPKCTSQLCISSLLKSGTVSKPLDRDQLIETRCFNRKKRLGSRLQNVALHVLNSMKLVPEHVETRTLYSLLSGNRACGRLRMFVDIFPMDYGPVPPPIDITPRRPLDYQIRVCIFNVANLIPVRESFGQPITDLYVKVYMNQSNDIERTDVHYRADGYAEFNWRFVYNIKFDPYENKIINSAKSGLFGKKKETLVDPVLIVELWDKRRFKEDTKIGEMHFDITNFKEGYTDPHQILSLKNRRRHCCTPRMCVCNVTCCMASCKNKKNRALPGTPFEVSEDSMKLSLLETDVCRGWWPVVTNIKPENNGALKKKNDDISHGYIVTGSVEMELSLLTAEDAAQDPVGKDRKEPNHSPYLAKPYRSTWNTFYITSRVRPFFGWCCHSFAPQIVLWIIMGTLLFFTIYGIKSVMKEFGIPNKIVIAGTSAMKLNDRFSNLPPPRKNVIHAKPMDAIVTTEVYNPFARREQQPFRFQETIPRRRLRGSQRPQNFASRMQNVPIESRLSIPFLANRGRPVARGGRGIGRGIARGKVVKTQNPVVSNEARSAFRNRGLNNKPARRGAKPIRGKKPQSQNENFGSKKSVEQLDQELDDYMRKKKHAPIII
ncbi:unnamed protein product [Auanema sp. JU1783]|nr:unnamed protein product [Auanema sp. JU1783]